MTDTLQSDLALSRTVSSSRRVALGGLTALLLASSDLARAQEATPGAKPETRLLAIQGFRHGTLFPTQGDAPDQPPYTLILWDAAEAGLFFVDRAGSAAGIIPTDRVLPALTASSPASVALVARPDESASAGEGEAVWALELVLGSAGSDPGAVTYQGDVRDDPTAATQFGIAPSAPPDGPRKFGPGYLIFTALPVSSLQGEDIVRLTIE